MASTTTAVRTLAHDTHLLLTAELRPLGITVPQLAFLEALQANPDHNGSETARAIHVSPQTGTSILQGLTRRHLVTVERIPGYGRRNIITITDNGANVLTKAREAMAGVEKLLADLLGDRGVERVAFAAEALEAHLPEPSKRSRKQRVDN